jgi:hypothetical protein
MKLYIYIECRWMELTSILKALTSHLGGDVEHELRTLILVSESAPCVECVFPSSQRKARVDGLGRRKEWRDNLCAHGGS